MATLDKNSSSIWVVTSQIFLLISNLLLLKLLTKNLSLEEFGGFSLYMSVALFSRQILYDPVSIVVAKECAKAANANEFKPKRLKFLSDEFRVATYLTDRAGIALMTLGLIVFLFASVLHDNSINGILILSCMAYTCANGGQGVYYNLLNSVSNRKPAALFSILDSISKLVFVFFSYFVFDRSLACTLIPVAFATCITFLTLRIFIINRLSDIESLQKSIVGIVKDRLHMSMPLYLPTLLTAVKSVGDRWILAAFVGLDDLAAYTVLLQLGYLPILLMIGIMQTIIAPKIYKLSALGRDNGFDELRQVLNKYLLRISAFACFAVGVAIGLSEVSFKLLTTEEYYKFSKYLGVFVASGILTASTSVLHVAVIGVFDTKFVGKVMTTTLLVSAAITILLTAVWGFLGAIAGLITSTSIVALIYWFVLYRVAFKRVGKLD